jgi:hypothetical protein
MNRDYLKHLGFAIAIPPTYLMVQIPEEKAISAKKWRRYRFYTHSFEDYRPLVFDPRFPWWCSGMAGDNSAATIIAWLPFDEPLSKYWDDASEIEFTEHETISFTDRFAKPEWFIES